MITAKFGGTAVTPRNLIYLKKIVSHFHGVVVVSAVGKEYGGDVKTTDLLERYYRTADESLWKRIEDKYKRLAEVNGIDVDVEKLLFEAKQRALRYDLGYCMSLGEELSAKTVSKYLNAAYVEAEEIVRFNSRGLAFDRTVANMKAAFAGVDLAVTGGYYGMGNNGRQTFSRGGSDVTGALCAVATDATLYENWTDVYGVCVADPGKVYNVTTVNFMSYQEMRALSRGGAEVLHPDAVAPVERRSIPIKIGNFYNPEGKSTLVCNCPSRNKLLSLAEKRVGGKVQTTVLHNMDVSEISEHIALFLKSGLAFVGCFDGVFSVRKNTVFSLDYTANKAVVVTRSSILSPLYKYFQNAGVI